MQTTEKSAGLYSLSIPQTDIYYEQLLVGNPAKFNIGAQVVIEGQLEVSCLERALNQVLNETDALRMYFVLQGDDPKICILPQVKAHLTTLTIEGIHAPEDEVDRIVRDEFSVGFDLFSPAPLCHFTLIKVSPTRYFLIAKYHHIIIDGWGASLMYRRWTQIYAQLLAGVQPESPELHLYSRFTEQNYQYLTSDKFQSDRAYWKKIFHDGQEPAFQITTSPYASIQDRFAKDTFYIPRKKYTELLHFCEGEKCSLFHFFIALILSYITRIAGKRSLVFGLPTLNRSDHSAKQTVGLFTTITPLKIEIDDSNSFCDVMKRVRALLKEAYRYQQFPMREIMKLSSMIGNTAQTLYDVFFSYERHDYAFSFGPAHCRVVPIVNSNHRCPISIYVREFDQVSDVKVDVAIRREYFDHLDVSSIAQHLFTLIHQLPTLKEKAFYALNYMAPSEKENLLRWGSGRQMQVRGYFDFMDAIQAQAKGGASCSAILCDDDRLSYAEMGAWVHKQGQYIARKLAGNESQIVAVLADRSIYLVPAILSIFEACAIYLPVDKNWPKERLLSILEDSDPAIILITKGSEALVPKPYFDRIIFLEDLEEDLSPLDDDLPLTEDRIERTYDDCCQIAYLIYTSGSTGRPKGVEVPFDALNNFLWGMLQQFSMCRGEQLLAHTSISFDISLLELLFPIIQGGTIVLASDSSCKDPYRLKELFESRQIKIMQATPSMWSLLIDSGWMGHQDLTILCGGENMPSRLAENLLHRGARLFNMYGPTETTIWSTVGHIMNYNFIHIGGPIVNTRVYVTDQFGQLLPVGVPGDLWIGGAGVALGYLGNAKLTYQRFLADPFAKDHRLYRTGDRCRWLEEGHLQYLQRDDDQIKINGHRVECGEIENLILETGCIFKVKVLQLDLHQKGRRLVAFISRSHAKEGVPNIYDYLSDRLPQYMVPVVVEVEQWPLLASGKTDIHQLKTFYIDKDFEAIRKGDTYTSPQFDAVVGIWKEGLVTDQLAPDDNFFDLGGDSMMAWRILNKVQQQFGVKVDFHYLYANPTIKSFCENLFNRPSLFSLDAVEKAQLTPMLLAPAQKRLWVLCQTEMGNRAYTMHTTMRVSGNLDVNRLKESFNKLVSAHPSLRTVFKFEKGQTIHYSVPQVDATCFFECIDVRSDPVPALALRSTLKSLSDMVFDLQVPPLLKVVVIRWDDLHCVIFFAIHHLIADGLSLHLMCTQLLKFYANNNFCGPELSNKVSYSKEGVYCSDNQRPLENEALILYWKQQLAGKIPPLYFVSEVGALHRLQPGPGKQFFFSLNRTHSDKIREVAREHGLTAYAVMLGMYIFSLSRLSGFNDAMIGVVTAGRMGTGTDEAIGNFINFLPFRWKLNNEDTVITFLKGIFRKLLEIDQHSDINLEEERELWLQNNMKARALYNTCLVMHSENTYGMVRQKAAEMGLRVSMLPTSTKTAALNFKLDIFDMGKDNNYRFALEFNTNTITQATAVAIRDKFVSAFALLFKMDTRLEHVERTEADEICIREERQAVTSLSIISSFIADPIKRFMESYAQLVRMNLTVSVVPSPQWFQQLIKANTEVSQGTIILLCIRWEDFLKKDGSNDQLEIGGESLFNATLELLVQLSKTHQLLFALMPFGSRQEEGSVSKRFKTWNRRLQELARCNDRVRLVSLLRLDSFYRFQDIDDHFSDAQANIPFSDDFFASAAAEIVRILHSRTREAAKVIVIDCDNTLWKGNCAEEGSVGVKIQQGHRALQRFLVQKYQEGVLLAIVSKNTEDDVRRVFRDNTGMILKEDFISAWRVNWQPKSVNIKEISKELSLKTDSFVFLDDNPAECLEVLSSVTDVYTLPLPHHQEDFRAFLFHIWLSDKWKVTEDDRMRSQHYKNDQLRQNLVKAASTLSDFYSKLNLKVSFFIGGPKEFDRVSQLSLRTTQFNLSGGRYTEYDLALLMQRGYYLFCVEASDMFGHYGLIGAALGYLKDELLFVESFFLSCRALGKQIETAVLYALNRFVQERGLNHICFSFHPTEKNLPARSFLMLHGQFDNQERGPQRVLSPCRLAEAPRHVTLLYMNRLPSLPLSDRPMDAIAGSSKKSRARKRGDLVDTDFLGQIRPDNIHFLHYNRLHYTTAAAIKDLAYDAPQNVTESESCRDINNELKQLYVKGLSVSYLDAEQDYFSQGGDSLGAMHLLSSVFYLFKKEIRLADFFKCPTLSQLQRLIFEMEHKSPAGVLSSPEVALSRSQQIVWMLTKSGNISSAYNQCVVFRVVGSLDKDILQDSFYELIRRYDILRTKFSLSDEHIFPTQMVLPHEQIEFQVEVIELAAARGAQTSGKEVIQQFKKTKFQFDQPPLIRVAIIKEENHADLLLCCIHNLIADGWSMKVVADHVTNLYRSLSQNKPLPSAPKQQYSYWVQHQEAKRSSATFTRDRQYWLQLFSSGIQETRLIGSEDRTLLQGTGGVKTFIVPNLSRTTLTELAREASVTPFIYLLSLTKAVLFYVTGNTTITIGTVVAGRDLHAQEDQIGLFTTVLLLSTNVGGEDRFCDVLQRVKSVQLDAFAHQSYSFYDLIEDMRRLSVDPIPCLHCMVIFDEFTSYKIEVDEKVQLELLSDDEPMNRFDICFSYSYDDGDIALKVTYDKSMFPTKGILRLLQKYEAAVKWLLINSTNVLSAFPEEKMDSITQLSQFDFQF